MSRQISITLSPEVEEYVRKKAEEEHRSVSGLIQLIVIEKMLKEKAAN